MNLRLRAIPPEDANCSGAICPPSTDVLGSVTDHPSLQRGEVLSLQNYPNQIPLVSISAVEFRTVHSPEERSDPEVFNDLAGKVVRLRRHYPELMSFVRQSRQTSFNVRVNDIFEHADLDESLPIDRHSPRHSLSIPRRKQGLESPV